MPYIELKTTKALSTTEENNLKTHLGNSIGIFPGKSESWLMCNIESDKKIWFQGNDTADSAFVEVKLFGSVDKKAADSFTSALCNYLKSELKIPSERTYIRYEGGTDWGWNGSNF